MYLILRMISSLAITCGVLLMILPSYIFSETPQKLTEVSIAEFLKENYLQLQELKESGQNPDQVVHVVLGNQSADMDSIMSAITFAYVKRDSGFYVPVINIQRDELILRGDVVYVLKQVNIDPQYLLFQEDLPYLLNLGKEKVMDLTLLDHNYLAPNQECFKGFVVQIIDHHKDENEQYPLLKQQNNTVMKMGSTATLVARSIAGDKNFTKEAAYLLLSALLLDTAHYQNKETTTPTDIEIGRLLEKKAANYYSVGLFDVLLKHRYAVENMTPDALLKKDFKSYQEGKLLYGIAGIPKGVSWTPENRSLWKQAFEQTLTAQKLDMLSALVYEGETKVFIVYIPNKLLQEAFLKHIQQNAALNKELIQKAAFEEEGLFFFSLRSPLARKQFQPLLQLQTIESLES